MSKVTVNNKLSWQEMKDLEDELTKEREELLNGSKKTGSKGQAKRRAKDSGQSHNESDGEGRRAIPV